MNTSCTTNTGGPTSESADDSSLRTTTEARPGRSNAKIVSAVCCTSTIGRPHERVDRILGQDWVLRGVRRICKSAGLPRVCAHSLRGTHATIAKGSGITGHEVARALGWGSGDGVGERHYYQPGTTAAAKARIVADALKGTTARETGAEAGNGLATKPLPNEVAAKSVEKT